MFCKNIARLAVAREHHLLVAMETKIIFLNIYNN